MIELHKHSHTQTHSYAIHTTVKLNEKYFTIHQYTTTHTHGTAENERSRPKGKYALFC